MPHAFRLVCLLALALLMPLAAAEPKPFPNMAPKVGAVIDNDYYDRARVQPRLMVERALRRLSLYETSIIAMAHWPENRIRLGIGAETMDIPATEPADLAQAMTIIERVRVKLEEDGRFKRERGRELSYALLNGALSVLDPHTEISAPDLAQMFREDMAGEFYGIGAFLRSDEGRITVERVIPGTPAERAGIEDGDIILAVNGEKTAGLDQTQAVRRIRGPKGTTVVLTVERKGSPRALDIPVVRDLVHSITLRSWRSGDVGYIRLDEFHARANQDLCGAFVDLGRGGPPKVLVLDMRYNGGGLLDQAKAICANFLDDEREIVRTVTVDGKPVIFKSRHRALIDMPVVVLVGPGTASAAEIVSGALQRNDRAVVAGRVTFGKGTVQTLRDLDDDSRLRLTIQEYRLPGDVSIQDIGVTPDLLLVQHMIRDGGRVDMQPPSYLREGDHEFAIANRMAYRHQSTYELGWLAHHISKEELKRLSIASRDFTPDQEAMLVIKLLEQVTAVEGFAAGAVQATKAHRMRPWLLERLKDPVADRAKIEAASLTEALAKQQPPVVWGPATSVPDGTLTITYTGPRDIEADTSTKLTFTVANSGQVDVGRLYGVVRTDKASPLWEDEVVVGCVPASGTVTAALPFTVPKRAYGGEERFTLELIQDGSRTPVAKLPVSLNIIAKPRPHLGFTWQIEDTNRLTPDEKPVNLVVTLTNDGAEPTGNLDVRIFKENDQFIELGQAIDKLPALAVGGTAPIKVPIQVKKQSVADGRTATFSATSVKVQLVVQERFEENKDNRYRVGLVHTIEIPVGTITEPRIVCPPKLSLLGVDTVGPNRVKLRIAVADGNLKYVGCFLDEDKLDLKPAAAVVGGVYTTIELGLKPGINHVQIFAVDQQDADQFLPLRLWGEGEPVVRKESGIEVP